MVMKFTTFAVGSTVVVILETAIIMVLAGRHQDQDEAVERVSDFDAELAFAQSLEDGRDVLVFDRNGNMTQIGDTPTQDP